nr:hypothetical protein [uncultured Mediterraneibacter sp.]
MSRTYALEVNGSTVDTPVYSDDNGGNSYYDSWGGQWSDSLNMWLGGWKVPGYGLKNYLSGGVPYVHTYRIPGTYNSSSGSQFANVEKLIAGDAASTPGTKTGQVDVKVSQASDSATFKAPVRNFTAGSRVKVRFETAIRNTDSSQVWNVIPNTLAVDVYTAQDQFSSENFTRETFELPTSGSKTYNLKTGGKVIIECKTYNGKNIYNNISDSPTRHERRFQDGYMFSTEYFNNYNINNNIPVNSTTSSFRGVVSDMSWYAYEVTVEGVYHDFKLYQTSTSGAHKNAILNFTDTAREAVILNPDIDGIGGADTSVIEGDMTRNGPRSYTFLRMSQVESQGKFRALELPFTFRSYMKPPNSEITLALAIRPGYSPPLVSRTSGSGVTITPVGYSGGVYKYNIALSGTDASDVPGVITVSSKAVEFRAQFWANGANINSPTRVDMGYGADQSRNYVIIPTEKVLTEHPKLDHFEVYLVKISGSNNGSSLKIVNLDDESNWHTGDIIKYDDVYTQATNASFLERDVDAYRLEIRPIETDTGNARVDGTYLIKEQTSFSQGNTYQSSSFKDVVSATVQAMKNSEVVIVGYKDQILDDTTYKHFKLGLRSQTSGTLNQANDVVAELYYLSAVQASIDTTNVKELEGDQTILNEIEEWNEQNKDKLYTSVNNESHFVNYKDIYDALKANYSDFRGFKIKDATTDEIYEYTLPEESGVNLFLIGEGSTNWNYTANSEIWNALFAENGTSRGRLVLVPTFGAPEKKIVSTSDSLITAGDGVDTYSMGNPDPYGRSGSFSVSGKFEYTGDKGDSQLASVRWALTRIKDDADANTAELLAYGTLGMNGDTVTADQDDQYGWASQDSGELVSIGKSGFDADTTEFQLLFNISQDSENPITYNDQQDAEYTIHAWIEDVGSTDALTSKGNTNYPSQNKLAGFPIAKASADVYNTFRNGTTTTDNATDVPGYTQAIRVLPQFVASTEQSQSGDSTQHLTADKTVAEGQDFDLTADFKYDDLYPAGLQGLSDSGTPTDNAKIHTALFRKAAGSSTSWTLWAWDDHLTTAAGSGDNAKVDVKKVTVGSDVGNLDKITVGYTIKNVSDSITKDLEEGAQYCIVAWNATNASFAVDETSVNSNLLPGSGTVYENVPSVTTTIAVDQNKITPVGDMISTGNPVTTYTNGSADPTVNNGRFQVSGTFKYTGDSMLTEGKLKFAVTKLEYQRDTNGDIIQNPTDGAPSQRYKLVAFGSVITQADGEAAIQDSNKGGQYLDESKLTLSDVTTNPGDGTVTLTFDVISVNNSIQYRWDQGAQYTVHAWSDGNTGPGITELKNMASTSGTTGAAADRHTQIANAFFNAAGDIPGEQHTVKVLPKRIATAGAQTHVTAAQKLVTAEQDYTLGVNFKYDTLYPKSLQDGTDTTVPEAQIHTAIFKKNPPEKPNQDWALWMWDSTVTNDGKTNAANKPDKVSREQLGLTNGTLSVTYNLLNAPNASGGSSITWEWEDGAQYYIVAWNGSNASFEVNVNNIKTNITPESDTEANRVTPSVTTPITLEWQDAQYYVNIPARVILSDDGDRFADGERSNYAGESAEVTYGTFSDKEAPEIEVKVSDNQPMTVPGASNSLTMKIYSATGEERTPTGGYSWLGILSKKKTDNTSGNIRSQNGETIPNGLPRGESLPFQINVETSSAPRKTMYEGKLLYDFTPRDWDNPS